MGESGDAPSTLTLQRHGDEMAGSPGSPSPETEEIAAKPATAPELRVQQRTHIVLPVQITGNWSCYDDYVVGNSGTNQR
ncbi:hypothetical protein EJB05_13261 [Eragrostis curvula]|uniref:Uncharacterized protein n=1 Tax=Eragrostis curvula TaxID=38414 RepID=A0A5J9VW01_9POAL|nr:hypothetical protein EJB05_13260 [Eragrostis curvula]TVU39821.1 hypothetical protein EJB05_13261 [Eragrostis curvula]